MTDLYRILHQDEDLIAVAKPAGITVIPGRNESLAQSVRGQLENQLRASVWVVHRLDRDTSGVLLFARNAGAHRALSIAFESRMVTKKYLAFACGSIRENSGSITVPLHTARKGKMRPAQPSEAESLAARTDYQVVARRDSLLGSISLLEVRPFSGRQHQIRVHLRSMGAPLVVDGLYGGRAEIKYAELGMNSPEVGRLTLHASQLKLLHPTTGAELTIQDTLPTDLSALSQWVRQS